MNVMAPISTSNLGLRHDFPVGESPWMIASGDFNGDGRWDVVTAHRSGDDDLVTALYGVPWGGFGWRRDTAVTTPPDAIIAGDFDGDG